jgi:hypothetical protein
LRLQERKHPRFDLKYRVKLKCHACNGVVVKLDAISRNVSMGGLLLETNTLIPERTAVSFILTMRGAPLIRPILLTGEAEVVRVVPRGPDNGFLIALQCKARSRR